MTQLKQALKWLQQYNKAFTAVLGVPLVTYLATVLITVLGQQGIELPFDAEQIAGAVMWLVALAVGAGVYYIPNKPVKKVKQEKKED